MKSSDRESKYWKSEYENLRRKKKKELDMQLVNINKFMSSTWKLLKLLGMSDREILEYYKKEREDVC